MGLVQFLVLMCHAPSMTLPYSSRQYLVRWEQDDSVVLLYAYQTLTD